MSVITIDVVSGTVTSRGLTPEEIAALPIPEVAAALALASERAGMKVSRLQARVALLQAGLLPQVEAAVAAADPIIQMAWAEAIELRRYSPAILGLASALGLTDTQLDDLFRAAALVDL